MITERFAGRSKNRDLLRRSGKGKARSGRRRPLRVEALEDRRLLTTGATGGGQAHENMQPTHVSNYVIAMQGVYPSRNIDAKPVVVNSNGEVLDNQPTGSSPYLGEIQLVGFNFNPRSWALANGQILPINSNQALFSLLGTTYGGDGRTSFALPDLRGRVPIGVGQGPGLPNYVWGQRGGSETNTLTTGAMPSHNHNVWGQQTSLVGGGQSFENMQPYLALNYIIALQGTYPSRAVQGEGDAELSGLEDSKKGDPGNLDTEPFIAEIRIFAGNFAPRGWALAQGQILPIAQYTALFSLVGTTYGGDGRTTLALPDLRGRAAVHAGRGPGLSQWRLGQRGGAQTTTLSVNNLASHAHTMPPAGPNTANNGGSQAFSNIMPSLAVNYIVSLFGVYPSRNIEPSGGGGEPGPAGPDPFVGEISMFAGNFAPRSWALADGQLLAISQNDALFSLFGTYYGGDGRTTFGLPEMRGRAVTHMGQGAGLTDRRLGQRFGRETVSLSVANLPSHTHAVPPPRLMVIERDVAQADPPNLPQGPQPTSWDQQRSMLASIDLTFSQPMSVIAGDFLLTNLGIDPDNDPDTVITLDPTQLTINGNDVVLDFTDDRLPDGVYELKVLATAKDANDNLIDGNADGTGGDEYVYAGNQTNRFYQLTGEWNGDTGVSVFDFTTFSYWFGTQVGEQAGEGPAYVDLNGDGGISVFDFSQFSGSFGDGVTLAPGFVAGTFVASRSDSDAASAVGSSPRIPGDETQFAALHDTALDQLLLEWGQGKPAAEIDGLSDSADAKEPDSLDQFIAAWENSDD